MARKNGKDHNPEKRPTFTEAKAAVIKILRSGPKTAAEMVPLLVNHFTTGKVKRNVNTDKVGALMKKMYEQNLIDCEIRQRVRYYHNK